MDDDFVELNKEKLNAAREKRMRDANACNILKECLIYFVFFGIFLCVCYSNLFYSSNSFNYQNNMRYIFDPEYQDDLNGKVLKTGLLKKQDAFK